MGAQLGRTLRCDKYERPSSSVAVPLVLIFILTGFIPPYVAATPNEAGCSRRFNNTYFTSPTRNLLQQAPDTIMFWIQAMDANLPNYTMNYDLERKSANNNNNNDGVNSYSGVIFNTGDFVDQTCYCNKRIVIVYRYDTLSVEAQIWQQNATEDWNCIRLVGTSDIQLSLWFHITFHYNTLMFDVQAQNTYSGKKYDGADSGSLSDTYSTAFVGLNYVGNPYKPSILTSLCNSTTVANLPVYFNFDECNGVSAHNMGGSSPHGCWACTDSLGKPCPTVGDADLWVPSIVQSRSCTDIGATCTSAKPDAAMLWGIPIKVLVGLGCGFVLALALCGGTAAYLGKKYRTQQYQSLESNETCIPPLLTLTDTENDPISVLSPHFPLPIGPAPPGFSINGSTDLNAIVPFYPKRNSRTPSPRSVSPNPPSPTNTTPPSTTTNTTTNTTTPRTAAVAGLIASAFMNGNRVNSPSSASPASPTSPHPPSPAHSSLESSFSSSSSVSSSSSSSPSSSPESSPSNSPSLIRSRPAPQPAPASAPAAPMPSPSITLSLTLSPDLTQKKTTSVSCVTKHTPPLPPHHGPLRKTTSTGQFQYLPPSSSSSSIPSSIIDISHSSSSSPSLLPRKSPSAESISRSYFDPDSPFSASPNPPTPSISITQNQSDNVFFSNTPIGNILNTPDYSILLSTSSSTPVSKHTTTPPPTVVVTTPRYLSSSVPTTPPRYLPAYFPTSQALDLISEHNNSEDFASTTSDSLSSSTASLSSSHVSQHVV